MMALAIDNIPADLQALPRWVLWNLESRDGKPTKVPYQARAPHALAEVNNPDTWASFSVAVAAFERMPEQYSGIGVVLGEGLAGIDLDNCINSATGELDSEAHKIVSKFNTYAEISPSGRGIKLLLKGALPENRGRQFKGKWADGKGQIELYDSGRYFALTGNAWAGAPLATNDCNAKLNELCERLDAAKRAKSPAARKLASGGDCDAHDVPVQVRVVRCRAFIKAMPDAISGQCGHNATLQAACECVRFDLDASYALDVMRWFNANKTGGEQWTEAELAHKLASAEKLSGHERGRRLAEKPAPADDEKTNNVIEYPDPMRLAEHYTQTRAAGGDGNPTLRRFAHQWWRWNKASYAPIDDEDHRAQIYQYIDSPLWTPQRDAKTGEPTGKLRRITANKKLFYEIDAALPATGLLVTGSTPQWLDGRTSSDPSQLLIARNGIYDLANDRMVSKPTPLLFSTSCLEFDFDPKAPEPIHWLRFLDSLWTDDPQSIELVQDWFGYCLTPDTRQQKSLMLVGPPRSGKGTIARTQTKLVGASNVCAPTLSGLGTNFGLWPLIGKQLAIVGDARLSGRTDQATIVERILSITGEDLLTIDRKCIESVNIRLTSRLMFLTNVLPNLSDASGALAKRFMFGILRRSFFDSEDHGLEQRIYSELPGILLWAIAGWRRLQERGRFIQPATSEASVREMTDLASPISAFVRDWCKLDPSASIPRNELFDAWKAWCMEQGKHAGSVPVFGRDLRAAVPNIETSSRRNEDGGRDRHYEGIHLTLQAANATAIWRSKSRSGDDRP
jgi:putative DNA primase/helicase